MLTGIFKKAVLIISLLLLFYCTHIAQAQVNIVLGGKNYFISQVGTDTLSRAAHYKQDDSLLKVGHFIKPISLSKYDLEIRFFYAYNDFANQFRMIIIKGNKHKLFMERYDCTRVYMITGDAQGVKLPGSVGYLWVKPKDYGNVTEQIQPILTQTIDMGLFNYPDKAKLVKDINNPKYVTTANSLHDYVFEIKLNGQYHSFRYDPRIYKNNPDVKELADGDAIANIFLKLLKN